LEILNNLVSNYWWVAVIVVFVYLYKFFQKQATNLEEDKRKLAILKLQQKNLDYLKCKKRLKTLENKKELRLQEQIELSALKVTINQQKDTFDKLNIEIDSLESKIKIQEGFQKLNPFKKLYS
jgi:arginyl-tRNA synthetase